MKKATFQIRVFVCLDDLTQPDIKGWNTIEHKVEIRGDVAAADANNLVAKITELVQLEAMKEGGK
jgi:hypothetical protein